MVLRIKYNEFQEYNEMQEKKPQQRQGHGAGQAVFLVRIWLQDLQDLQRIVQLKHFIGLV